MENTYNRGSNLNIMQEPMNIGVIKMPKNIRQIGNVGTQNRTIYVEDYVMTYVKQLSGKEYSNCKIAVLLGHYIRTEDGKNLFVKGAVEMKGVDCSNGIVFTDEGWTSIYESIKKYFTDVEIVGWVLIGTEFFLEGGEKIRKIHTDNFAGPDKTLLKIDIMEKEEIFYLYENNELVKQPGYYIYYEKNEEMQGYMVENREVVSEETKYLDQTTKKIRNIIQEKKVPKEEKNVVHLLYAASTLLAVIVLVIAAAMLGNYDQLKNMEAAISAISDNLMGGSKDNQSVESSQEKEDSKGIAEEQSNDANQTTKDNQRSDNSQVPDDEKNTEKNQVTDTSTQDNQTKDENQAVETNKGTTEKADNLVNMDSTNDDIKPSDKEQTKSDENETVEVETISGNISKEVDGNTKNEDDVEDNSKKSTQPEQNTTEEKGSDEKVTDEKASEEKVNKETTESTQATDKKDTSTKDTSTKETPNKSTVSSVKINYYVVQSGDSLAGISYKLYNSANYINAIKELNGIEDVNKIFEGQKLIVP